MVMNTSNSRAARCKSSPYLIPSQPSLVTWLISCPWRESARPRGRHSSSSTRTRHQRLVSQLQRSDCLLAGHARKLVQELIEGFPVLQEIDQVLHRHSSA